MLDFHPVLLLFGLLGLGLFGSSSNDEDAASSADADEEPVDDTSSHESPFAPEADDPFDLDYKEPESPAENPFASEDEEPVDTETVPHTRPDGSSPFEDVATSVLLASSRRFPRFFGTEYAGGRPPGGVRSTVGRRLVPRAP